MSLILLADSSTKKYKAYLFDICGFDGTVEVATLA